MNRRSFLATLLGIVIARKSAPEFVWDKNRFDIVPIDYVPHIGIPGVPDASMFGIPYHCTNAATGRWLGLVRDNAQLMLDNPRSCAIITNIEEPNDTRTIIS